SWIETLPRRGYRFAGQVEEVVLDVELQRVEEQEKTEVRISVETELKAPPKSWTWAVAGVLLVAVSGFAVWRGRSTTEIRSMAVLPFQPIAGGGQDQETGMGITDSLIGTLGAEGRWLVRPTGAVRAYAEGNRDP